LTEIQVTLGYMQLIELLYFKFLFYNKASRRELLLGCL
jgi:hypothetical protein